MFDLDIPFFPEQASTIAVLTDVFTFGVIGLGLIIGIIVVILMISFVVRYNHDTTADRTNPVDEHTTLELTWSFIPLVLVLSIFVWSANIYYNLYNPPSNAINMYVIGKQWMWKIQHPDGQREVNTLHMPVNQPIKLTMTSEDVIHSFYVPAFRIKQDVLPGRFTVMWFEATQTGEHLLLCAEFCGTEHSFMVGKVIVMEPDEYEKWLREGQTALGANAAAPAGQTISGDALFTQKGCVTCHKIDGTQGLGPNLKAVGTQVELDTGDKVDYNEEYMRESMINPQAKIAKGFSNIMPTYQGQLSEEEIILLIEYVKLLNGGK